MRHTGGEGSARGTTLATAALALVALGAVTAAGDPAAGAATASACPTRVAPATFASTARLRRDNVTEWRFGHPRPTGGAVQQRLIAWIERQLRAVPGVRLSLLRFPIRRWDARSASLRIVIGGRSVELPIAGPVPYSHPTGARGTTAPLAVVPDDQPLTAANSAGRMVVRDAPAGTVPYSVFFPGLLGWSVFDPGQTLDPSRPYRGDFLDYDARVKDLRDAAAAGAAGVLFVKQLPRAQIRDHYEPYEGVQWGVPGAFLGADEGKRIRDGLAAGQATEATLVLRATRHRVVTPSVLATIPGRSTSRIVIDSHTDGTNAVEDNGPVAMLAMARYLAGLPRSCRPRTVEFAFSTAHFYQRVAFPNERHGGAGQLAKRLDRDYDRGTVAGVMVLEHLGAREYAERPRADGIGQTLVATGRPELDTIGVSDSPRLVAAVRRVVVRHDLRRTALLRGADIAGDHVPPHCSFGGEGTPYNERLLPTVADIAAPQSLYDPGFGPTSIDFGLMYRQTLAFTDLVLELSRMSRSDIAGRVLQYRAERRAGAHVCQAP
jgi:hypothetical protein